MRKRWKLLAVFACLGVIAALAGLLTHDSEPRYQGRTMAQWLRTRGPEAQPALFVLGTNNLPLLVHRIAYNPVKDPLIRLYQVLPAGLRSRRAFDFLGRRNRLADDAQGVLRIVGPRAAQVVPQVTTILRPGAPIPSGRALDVLTYMGHEGLSAVTAVAGDANHPMRLQAMFALGDISARSAATNELHWLAPFPPTNAVPP